MKLYLVWVRESYCDYDVVAVFDNETEAKKFIEKEPGKYVDGTWSHDSGDFYITEREINTPTHIKF